MLDTKSEFVRVEKAGPFVGFLAVARSCLLGCVCNAILQLIYFGVDSHRAIVAGML